MTQLTVRSARIVAQVVCALAAIGWIVAWNWQSQHRILAVLGLSAIVVLSWMLLRQFKLLTIQTHDSCREFEAEIARREAAEGLLREQKEFLHYVIDLNPNLIFAKDRQGRFTLVNQAVADAYGRSVDELLGCTDSDFNSNLDEVAHFRRDDLLVMDTLRELVVDEEELTDATGVRRWLTTVKRPILGANGRADQVLGVATDITLRKRTEEELYEHKHNLEQLVQKRTNELLMSREQLQQSERMASVGVLAAGIAHEINNPVGTILLAAQNALEQSEECKTLAESQALLRRTCDAIVVNATRCTQIVRGVMQFSRHQATEKWANDINDIVLSAVRLLSDTTEGASRAPILELGVGLPELPLNPIEIEQVIVNLVKNAWEAAPNGVTVIVRTERSHDDGVVLSVEDNGPGISPEQQRQIFDPFFTTRLQAGGTGLGLSLVHGIIKSHRGRIDVDSAPGHGTRIYVVFPVSTSEVASTYSY